MALGGEASNLRKELNKPPSGEKWETVTDAFIWGSALGCLLALAICLFLHFFAIDPEYSAAFTIHLCPCDWAIFVICMSAGMFFFLGDLVPDKIKSTKTSVIIAVCVVAIGAAIIVQADLWNSDMKEYEAVKKTVEEINEKTHYNDQLVQEEMDREVKDGIIYDDSNGEEHFDDSGVPY